MYVHTYVWGRQQGSKFIILEFSPKLSTNNLVHFICPALCCACTVSNAISNFTPSKISFPSPENVLSDRAEHWSRQINCATKNKNPTRVFFPTQPQLKVISTLLFWNEYFFHYYYSFEKSTVFTNEYFENCTLTLFRRVIRVVVKRVRVQFSKYSFVKTVLFSKE